MTDPEAIALTELLTRLTGASGVGEFEKLQQLWSGYGEILRAHLTFAPSSTVAERAPTSGALGDSGERTVIVKWVQPPSQARHPRGWHSSRSHERKLESYRVEKTFYERFANHTNRDCRVPKPLHLEEADGHWLFVFEDLDAAGFPGRHHALREAELVACLSWLASFHARFLGTDSEGLWTQGTYWHLETRPEEYSVMPEGRLKTAARALDEQLDRCRHRTLVHGDAKVANFCFQETDAPPPNLIPAKRSRSGCCSTTHLPETLPEVAALDFQYVGGGCGMKDVAYFFSSCLSEHELEQNAPRYLDWYFQLLRKRLDEFDRNVDQDDLEEEWRALYPIAWADFFRFLAGWAPSHHKIHDYSRRMTETALASVPPARSVS